jgi:hypothetical protein
MTSTTKMRPAEEFAWKAFFDAAPSFTGEPIAGWQPGAEPPDVLCTTMAGKRIGVELTRWLVASEVRDRAGQELQQNEVLRTVASEKESRPGHIGFVNLELSSTTRLRKQDSTAFKEQLFRFLNAENAKPLKPTTLDPFKAAPDWTKFQRFQQALAKFDSYPMLAKYLSSIMIFPREWAPAPVAGIAWVQFQAFGGASAHNVMVDAAVAEITKKVDKYTAKNPRFNQSLNEFDLLCHTCEQTLKFNGPLFASLDHVAVGVRSQIAGQTMYDRIFLFHDYEELKVVPVYP